LLGRLLLDAAKAQATEVDLDSFRRAIESTVAVGDFVDYRSMYDHASNVEALIASIQDLLDAGHGEAVVKLCEHALEALEDAWAAWTTPTATWDPYATTLSRCTTMPA
jgi:hypothetical protein